MESISSSILTPEKLVYSSRILEVSIGCGSFIAFSVKEFTATKKDAINIYLHNIDTGKTIQFTRNNAGERSTQPEIVALYQPGEADHLLFLKDGKIMIAPLAGGESYVLMEEAVPINSYKIYHDGFYNTHIIAEMEVFADLSPEQTKAKDKDIAESGTSATLFNSLMIRHWNTWGAYEKRNHLFVKMIQLNGNQKFETVSDPVVDMMLGMHTDCPGKGPGGGMDAYSISPNGEFIVMACRNIDEETKQQPANFAWATDIPIFIASLDRPLILTEEESEASATPTSSSFVWKKISSQECIAYNTFPVFSSDSKKIAFLSMKRAQYESDRNRISIYDIESDSLTILTEEIDISFDSLEWNTHSSARELFATGQYRGSSRVFRIRLNESYTVVTSIEIFISDESRFHFLHLTSNKNDYLIYLESTLSYPMEIRSLDLSKPGEREVFVPFVIEDHQVNQEKEVQLLDYPELIQTIFTITPEYTNNDILLPEIEQHYFQGAQNDPVQCWYLPPVLPNTRPRKEGVHYPDTIDPNTLPKESIPLLVIIHGGPQVALMNSWNYRWNLSTFASQGYGVIAINYHGSAGFGEVFQDSIRHDWGGKPYEDILLGIDYILQEYAYLHPKKIAALGGSYGGYMINWMNGHTDRFACMVNHAGVFSLQSECLTTEELFFPEWEFGLPWEKKSVNDDYQKWSPDQYLQHWKTPTLIIHGGKDFRVPESEGIAAFTVLQRKGIPSKFLYFPDECHWILKPGNSIKWYQTIFDWLKTYLK